MNPLYDRIKQNFDKQGLTRITTIGKVLQSGKKIDDLRRLCL